MTFDILNSKTLSAFEKEVLLKNLASKLTKNQVLILYCEESRSQHRNKEIAIKRFLTLLKKSLQQPKKRKATKPTKASIVKKAENKRKHALKKALRKKPDLR